MYIPTLEFMKIISEEKQVHRLGSLAEFIRSEYPLEGLAIRHDLSRARKKVWRLSLVRHAEARHSGGKTMGGKTAKNECCCPFTPAACC